MNTTNASNTSGKALDHLPEIEKKETRLLEILKEMKRIAVAFSGGIDSAYLLMMAHEALPGSTLAVIARSPAFPEEEFSHAMAFAERLGVPVEVIETSELELPGFRNNPPNRCYLCKMELFARVLRVAGSYDMTWVAEGSNRDDLSDYRPGRAALAKLGIRSPLLEAGFTKQDIRRAARRRSIAFWDKPAQACLYSRIPYNDIITVERLRRIERAEAFLRGQGLRQVRLRDHGELARVEADQTIWEKLREPRFRRMVLDKLRDLGYAYITIDLAGYRTGSMNEILEKDA